MFTTIENATMIAEIYILILKVYIDFRSVLQEAIKRNEET